MPTFKDIPGFNNGTNGIIITRNYEMFKQARPLCNVKSWWWHAESERFFISDPSCNFSIYFVKPGAYSLSSVDIYSFNVRKYVNRLRDFASFYVNPGEVIYIGDLVYTNEGSLVAVTLKVEDHYEEAKLYFRKHYPEITKTPTKRLIEFSDRIKQAKRLFLEYGSLQ